MGYLLKEALKTLCGVNQWSYAAFWKFDCQNPKLLIWEECCYEPASCYGRPGISGTGISDISYQDYNASSFSTETLTLRPGVSEGNKVHLLVNKMMVDNHVNVVGEGLVGRVAFTGNHQWILSENYYRETHPPEVLKEVCLQFSAGMQTVAVVPILPHGVAQFGSFLTITENIGFLDGVVSLIHELGCVPGALQSTNQEAYELVPKVGFPPCPGYSTQKLPLDSYVMDTSSFGADTLNYVGCSAQTSAFDCQIPFPLTGEVQNVMQPSSAVFLGSKSSFLRKLNACHEEAEPSQANKLDFSFPNQFMNGLVKAEVVPSNSVAWMNQCSPLNIPSSVEDSFFCSSSALAHASIRCQERKILPDNVSDVQFIKPVPAGIRVFDVEPNSGANDLHMNNKVAQYEVSHCEEEMKQSVLSHEIPLTEHARQLKVCESIPGFVGDDRMLETEDWCHPVNSINDKTSLGSQSGDDLFDILGADFKDKWLSNWWRSCLSDKSPIIMPNCDANISASKNNLASSDIYYTNSRGKSGSRISSFTGSNHLLDAVVSQVHPFAKQSLDNTISGGSTLNNTSCSSAPAAVLPYGNFGVSDDTQGDLLGMPRNAVKAGTVFPSSLSTASMNDDSGIYSQGSSICDPWIGRAHNSRHSDSDTTGYSTKPNEPSKTNRKRLKPGESSKPRPKDRQMIQDRVKELREIVPNGAKCSIDALLERTIKHMIFLQSVTKHADKLKQTAESKIISKDGGLLLKDNHGGATWAYEVGSQSMVCPIIVEDLNQPHQMLVEMLCEERGLFLEIADIIRGLGFTILKGLMETRKDKIWAQFSVEASRNVTRMDVFISLVRLLEQNAKCDVAQSTNTKNLMVQEVHQAAPVPTSGGLLNDSIC